MKHMYKTPKTDYADLIRTVQILCASGEESSSKSVEVTNETANKMAAF